MWTHMHMPQAYSVGLNLPGPVPFLFGLFFMQDFTFVTEFFQQLDWIGSHLPSTPTTSPPKRSVLVRHQQYGSSGMSQNEPATVSLDPRYVETSFEYDRLYQTYSLEEEIYCVPVDEEEEDRLETQHEVLKAFFGNKLFFGNVSSKPRKVLDCGYGQAQWAIEVAEKYPDCQVTGVDIHPSDLPDIPNNITLECDDLNRRLTEVYPLNEFDVIQSRFVAPGINKDRWSTYVQELMRLLQPGGWLQMIEYYYNFQSHSGRLNSSNALYEWGEKYRQAMERDRNPRIGSMGTLAELMRAARLDEIQYQNCSLPIGGWSRDETEKEIGRRNLGNIDRMLDSLSTWAFRKRLGMTQEEVKALNDRARDEARNPRYKTYIPLTIAWARKPGGS